jgi:hypothetical protein
MRSGETLGGIHKSRGRDTAPQSSVSDEAAVGAFASLDFTIDRRAASASEACSVEFKC